MRLIWVLIAATCMLSAETPETIQFKSLDGLMITANYYEAKTNAPLILLFHQAGWSRGEYNEIAPKLNKLGFNCLAIDQRSGKAVNGVENQTYLRAQKAGKATNFPDALQDMQATLNYAQKNIPATKIIIWGSSYSAALTFVLAANNPGTINGLLAFAPGEYFKRFDKPGDFIQSHAKKLNVPVFITSAKDELKNWKPIFDVIPGKTKQTFLPKTEGQHGSRALWEKFPEHKEYWSAVSRFLDSVR